MEGLKGGGRSRGSFGEEDERMQDDTREAPIASAKTWPMVPYTPIRCPGCGENRVFYGGRHGRTRYHRCRACGTKFRSWETGTAGKDMGDAAGE